MSVHSNTIVSDIVQIQPLISNMVSQEQVHSMLEKIKSIEDQNIAGDVVELGCNVGTSALFLQRMIKSYCPERKLYVYDSFAGLPEKTNHDEPSIVSTNHRFDSGCLRATIEQFVQNFVDANVEIPIIHKGWFGDIPYSELPQKIAFAFFDGDFYSSIIDSFEKVYPRMTKGGQICIHDYQWNMLPGVQKACKDFLADKPEHGTIISRYNMAWITKL